MLNIIKVILFVIVNIAGWFAVAIVANVALKLGVFPELPPGPPLAEFKYWLFVGGFFVWAACALVSIIYFFIENEWKNWILLAPMFIPAAYATIVMVYFSFIYR